MFGALGVNTRWGRQALIETAWVILNCARPNPWLTIQPYP